MKRTAFALLTILSFFPLGAGAVTPAELAEKAEKNYGRGQYAQAASDWQTLTEIGFQNGSVFNNLGSAYWREGRVGLARLNFLRAVALEPRNADFRANLQFTEHPDQAPAAPGPWNLLKRIPFYKVSLNFYEALLASALCSALLFLVLALGRLKPFTGWKIAALVLLLPWLASASQLAYTSYRRFAVQPAVLITPGADLLANPVLGGPTLAPILEGSLLRVLKKQGDFYQVKTLEGQKGWLPSASVGEVG